ncbi:hypothetical protein H0A36_17960 [Endozoicomonas sp. SM1973]|uniref:Uncharacterized protein n=1 Tax=Spartinivicinus marinus TaxID=2994442 RepID=A0A853ICW0_9GAMM|nr:hypothetical protein [Spartinivicinus marinus]MCX4026004.1 hypothetical protein [Spartinivicinus marinus]NYZ67904.1 hypothetical protein [Spartinivicinus marinus]
MKLHLVWDNGVLYPHNEPQQLQSVVPASSEQTPETKQTTYDHLIDSLEKTLQGYQTRQWQAVDKPDQKPSDVVEIPDLSHNELEIVSAYFRKDASLICRFLK